MRTTPTTYRRLAAFVVALVALPLLAATAIGAGRPAGMTPAQYRAEMIRGQALNDRYGLGVPTGMTAAQYRAELIRGQALNEKYGLGVPTGMTAAQYRAELIRGRGMNALYVNQHRVPPATPVATTANGGFDWTDAFIGAAVAAGVLLLGAGLAKTARHGRHWHPHAPVS